MYRSNYFSDISLLAFILSLLLHLAVLCYFIFMVTFDKKYDSEEKVIVFDLLPVSAKSNVLPTKPKNDSKDIDLANAKKVISKSPEKAALASKDGKETAQKADIDSKALDHQAQTQKEKLDDRIKIPEKSEKDQKKTIEEKNEKAAQASKGKKAKESLENKKVKNSDVKKEDSKGKNKDKVKKYINDKELDSLLKTLEEASDGENAKSAKYTSKPSDSVFDKYADSENFDENMSLSVSERSMIQALISQNWTPPIGSIGLEDIRIFIYISLDINGAVMKVQVTDKKCGRASSDLCSLVEQGATRAIWKSSPFDRLTKERHDVWKEFNFVFDPSKIAN